ncbi:DNA replication licensing factor MCM4 [Nematocida sp. AWRm77]|nr:DNA replication licensing factor MCM4 [Nematocida sp. AWRm77]
MPREDSESLPHSAAFSFEDASQLHLSTSQGPTSCASEYLEVEDERFSGKSCTQENIRVVWGTTISIQETIDLFKEFIRTYTENGDRCAYLDRIDEMHDIDAHTFHLDCSHLCTEKYAKLHHEILHYPVEVLPLLEMGIADLYLEKYPTSPARIQVLLYNVGNPKDIKELMPADIDTTVEITGMVTKTSSIIPDITTAVYVCNKCRNAISAEVVRGVIAEPVDCTCGEKFSMEMHSARSLFQDKQIVKIQELPEQAKDGFIPSTITVVANGSLTDKLVPGDKVQIVGVYRAVPLKLNYIHRTIKSSFKTYLEMNSFTNLAEKTRPEKRDALHILEQIEALRTLPNLYETLAESIAPSIYGMKDVKKALLLQLFGGVTKIFSHSGARFRGDINVLLAGDPGVAKSQLLLAIHRLVDRGVYTSGKGSSAVGLTANISRDPESGQHILESGALVISDGGVCCIDEFDKMGEATRSVLHEAMEQQTVSVAKAGIITTLNARCSILAACNPIGSHYNPKQNIIENLCIPPTLLSRFDIVCLLLDKVDAKRDREISTHIIHLYAGIEDPNPVASVPHDVLKEYIAEGRKISPRISEEASKRICAGYQELRLLGNGKSVTATTRQLESIIRLSEAHARMRLSSFVEEQDVDEALRLIKDSLHIYAVDPITGCIDMELIHTGKTSAAIRMEDALKDEVMKVLGKGTTLALLLERLNRTTRVSEKALLSILAILQEEGKLLFDGLHITPN